MVPGSLTGSRRSTWLGRDTVAVAGEPNGCFQYLLQLYQWFEEN